jgi:hypothetical protein
MRGYSEKCGGPRWARGSAPRSDYVDLMICCFNDDLGTMTSYVLAQDSWMDTEFIRILSHANQFIGEFPLSFVQRGGINKWSYVWDVVDQLVEPGNRGSIKDHNGELMRHEDQPVAGTYFLEPESEPSELGRVRSAG